MVNRIIAGLLPSSIEPFDVRQWQVLHLAPVWHAFPCYS